MKITLVEKKPPWIEAKSWLPLYLLEIHLRYVRNKKIDQSVYSGERYGDCCHERLCWKKKSWKSDKEMEALEAATS